MDIHKEFNIFFKFFIEVFLLLIIIQIVSNKVDNNDINYIKDIKMAIIISTILYIAKYINNDASDNILQGLHYSVSAVFLSQYLV